MPEMLSIPEGQIILVVMPENVKVYKTIHRFYYNNVDRNDVQQLITSLLRQNYILEIDYMTWVIH